jgi:acyl-CoA reductase-like NAD-dependent aldehyde dehydrogenase
MVQASVMDQVLAKLAKKCESIAKRMGSPSNPKSSMGPLVSEKQLTNVVAIVDEAVLQGASVLCGGKRMTGQSSLDDCDFEKGYYYPPTVLHDGSSAKIVDTRLWKDEAFGPVIVVVGFKDEDEAINLANDSEFGLGASLWTTDLSQAFRVSEQIDSGIIWGKWPATNPIRKLLYFSKHPSSK